MLQLKAGIKTHYECLEYNYGYEKEHFWISGVILVCIGVFGVFGNILNFIVLSRQRFRNEVFYRLLVVLTCFDGIFIISYGLGFGYYSLACSGDIQELMHAMTHPVALIGLTGSTYTTVAVSIERYLGICHPNSRQARKTWVYTMAIAIVTIGYNIPRCFEYRFSVVNGTLIATKTSWAQTDLYNQNYHQFAALIIDSVIPFLALFFLNGSILHRVYFLIIDDRVLGDISKRHRTTMSKTLLLIVAVFLVCHLPAIIYNLSGIIITEKENKWYWMHPIDALGLVVNSSVNTLIYCLVGTKFREELKTMSSEVSESIRGSIKRVVTR